MWTDFCKKLEESLKIEFPYSVRPVLEGKPAGVLALFASSPKQKPHLLITRRTESVETHKGQYALPGGMMDAEDEAQEGLITTALRETEEEVGIARHAIKPMGSLPKLWTPTGFLITPVVGIITQSYDTISLQPNADEISEAFWVSLSKLKEPGVYKQEMRQIGSVKFPTDVFEIEHHRVWGATGAVLKNLIGRLEQVGYSFK